MVLVLTNPATKYCGRWQESAYATMAFCSMLVCQVDLHRASLACSGLDCITREEGVPDGDGVASTGSRPRTIAHWRAVALPSSFHDKELLLTWGTTSVRMGMGGLYLLTRAAVVPGSQISASCQLQDFGTCFACDGAAFRPITGKRVKHAMRKPSASPSSW